MNINVKSVCLLIVLVWPFNAFSSGDILTLESDWLKFEEGSTGMTLGAKVENIESQGTNSDTTLELSLPLNNLADFDSIEVISRKNGDLIEQKKPAVWIEDYENGKSGLRLFLMKKPAVEFRIRLIDDKRD